MIMKYRDIARIAVFGSLWGVVEITIGMTLKGLRIPMAGALLSAIAVIIALTGRTFVPVRGSILMMGAIAGIIKLFSIGTVIASPFLAILAEAALAEVIVSILGFKRLGCFIAGIFVVCYTVIHPLLAQGLIFGTDIYTIYLETFRRVAEVLGVQSGKLLWIIVVYVVIHILLGAAAGWMGYKLPGRVAGELRKLQSAQKNRT